MSEFEQAECSVLNKRAQSSNSGSGMSTGYDKTERMCPRATHNVQQAVSV
jgi:hypothetical protein